MIFTLVVLSVMLVASSVILVAALLETVRHEGSGMFPTCCEECEGR